MVSDAIKQQIRDEFVHGYVDEQGVRQFPTLSALAIKHDVSQRTLYRYNESEDWQRQKNEYQTELTRRLDDERLEQLVEQGKMLDTNALQIANFMLGRVGRRLQTAAQMERDSDGLMVISARELHELSQVTANAQKVGKLALGQAQEISKVSADVSNPEAFSAVMEQLDQLAESRASEIRSDLH